MADVHTANPGLPGRRAVLGAAVWSVPVIALVTATPAFAASHAVGVDDLYPALKKTSRIKSGQDTVALETDAEFAYRPQANQGPSVLAFTWVITVSGPTGNHTVASGSDNVAKHGSWKKPGVRYSPGGVMPAGTYTLTLTINASGIGSTSTTDSISV